MSNEDNIVGLEEDIESTLNMASVSISEFCRFIEENLEDENYKPILALGKSGIGKTESIKQLAIKLKIGYKEIRLVNMTETEMFGLPYVDKKTGKTIYATQSLFPDAEIDGEVGILALDEITSADKVVRTAAYQLLDTQRRLGEYTLPPKWIVVVLGNGPNDGGVFRGMECAFLSRCTCYRIREDFDVWNDWAVKAGVNKSIIAFLRSGVGRPFFHDFDPNAIAQVFPCPRTWKALSDRLNAREKRAANGILDLRSVEIYAAGAIGAKVSHYFSSFYAYTDEMINVEDILEGRKPEVKTIADEALEITIQGIVQTLSKELEKECKGYTEKDISDRAIALCSNTVKWGVGILAERRLDKAINLITQLGKMVHFTIIVLNSERFEKACPEYDEFAEKNDIVFGESSI